MIKKAINRAADWICTILSTDSRTAVGCRALSMIQMH